MSFFAIISSNLYYSYCIIIPYMQKKTCYAYKLFRRKLNYMKIFGLLTKFCLHSRIIVDCNLYRCEIFIRTHKFIIYQFICLGKLSREYSFMVNHSITGSALRSNLHCYFTNLHGCHTKAHCCCLS